VGDEIEGNREIKVSERMKVVKEVEASERD
jgi:hypothetical protein